MLESAVYNAVILYHSLEFTLRCMAKALAMSIQEMIKKISNAFYKDLKKIQMKH